MWVLVVGGRRAASRPDGAVATLRDLGCEVRTIDLWDRLDLPEQGEVPAVVIVEAEDEVDAGRAALMRVRAAPGLAEVPAIIALSVGALSRLSLGDGFDDLVLMPYVPPELYARVRRAEWQKSDFAAQERIKIGPLSVDLAGHAVKVEGRDVELTHQEFALLRFFCQNRGRVFTRQQLLERVWGVDYYGGSRTVDIHVRRLRMKLGAGVGTLRTVRGVGYKMESA